MDRLGLGGRAHTVVFALHHPEPAGALSKMAARPPDGFNQQFGDDGQSWKEAASFFQSKISKADWQNALQQARLPLGAAGNRSLMGSMYQTDLPGAPKGEYVVIQYKTEFAGKNQFIETITPMLDKDGKWRVSGYFIKPAQ